MQHGFKWFREALISALRQRCSVAGIHVAKRNSRSSFTRLMYFLGASFAPRTPEEECVHIWRERQQTFAVALSCLART